MEQINKLTREEAETIDRAVAIIQSRLVTNGGKESSAMLSFRPTWHSHTYFDRFGDQHPDYAEKPISDFINQCIDIENNLTFTEEGRRQKRIAALRKELLDLTGTEA